MESKKHKMTAYRICEKIPIRLLSNIDLVIGGVIASRSSEYLELHSQDFRMYIFNFGSIAFFNCPQPQQEEVITRFLNEFSAVISGIQSDLTSVSDSLSIRTGEKTRIDFDGINLEDLDDQPLRISALLLSHSVVLDYYEQHVENILEQSTNYLTKLKARSTIPRNTKDLVNFMVESMQTKQNIITNLFVFDSPEEVWDDPYLDKLYGSIKRMLEIAPRFKAIDYKLKLIQENLSLITNLSSARSGFWLELTIVLLILFEIMMTIFNHIF